MGYSLCPGSSSSSLGSFRGPPACTSFWLVPCTHSASFFHTAVPAMITSHPNTTIAIKGQPKELNCTARGERPIIIRWEKGDTVIDPDRNIRYAITTKDNGDEVISTLKVRSTLSRQAGRGGEGRAGVCACARARALGNLLSGQVPHQGSDCPG